MRTIPHMNAYLYPLDEIITKKSLQTLIESIASDDERVLYSLQIRDGGLIIPILQEFASTHYE